MSEKNIEIKSVKNLLGEKFNIPRYQRGYRWEENQIIELLDDIYDYGKTAYGQKACEDNIGDFYCLQPIVVRCNEQKENNKIWWDVIDGQQRLTTIFIIIKYIQYLFPRIQIPLFVIDYETRNAAQTANKEQGCEFLNNITFVPNKKPNTDNIDFYFMDMCSIYIEKWFTSSSHQGAEDIIKMILTSAEQKNVSVIWYEVDMITDNDVSSNPIDVFTRLNIGKIPLTDSELIKAFLLQGDRYKKKEGKYIQQRLFEIAKEWDLIEYHLQKDEMWAFLNNNNYKPESRIEYLFRLLSENWNSTLDEKQRIKSMGKHFEYHVFEKYISNMRKNKGNNIETVAGIFDEIKILFSVLDEWYNDRRIYHYIGFLVCCNKDEKESEKLIKDLFYYFLGKEHSNEKYGHTRKECLYYIKSKIKEIIGLASGQKLEKLNYYDKSHYDKLLKILLFLNIETTIMLGKENTFFPFYLYKEEVQSIEHIDPQTPEEMDCEQARTWLNSKASEFLSITENINISENEKKECKDINEKIEYFLKLLNNDNYKNKKDEFDNLSCEIDGLHIKIKKVSADETDTLSNYALVGKFVNSKLSNHSFKDKREIIINIINGETFDSYIPVCTRNIFQKYYTLQPDNIILWDKKDRTEYFEAMKNIYNDFMGTYIKEANN